MYRISTHCKWTSKMKTIKEYQQEVVEFCNSIWQLKGGVGVSRIRQKRTVSKNFVFFGKKYLLILGRWQIIFLLLLFCFHFFPKKNCFYFFWKRISHTSSKRFLQHLKNQFVIINKNAIFSDHCEAFVHFFKFLKLFKIFTSFTAILLLFFFFFFRQIW